MTMRCVITDFMGDDPSLEASLLHEAGIDAFVAPEPDPATWADAAVEADAILTRHAPVREDTIRRLRRCRVISRYGTGHDNIDVPVALERGIVVTNVPDYCSDEAAEHAITLLLMAARRADVLTRSVREGGWTPQPLPPIRRIRGSSLGLIGYGRIGAGVARRGRGLGLVVHVFDPYLARPPEGVTMQPTVEDLLRRVDMVSLHAPLTDETRRILDAERLALLPPGAIVVNASRGGLLDLDAAIEALRSGHLAAVAVDVADQEPLPVDHVARDLPGLIVTPHVAYYSLTSVDEAKRRSTAEIVRVLRGDPPENPVTLG